MIGNGFGPRAVWCHEPQQESDCKAAAMREDRDQGVVNPSTICQIDRKNTLVTIRPSHTAGQVRRSAYAKRSQMEDRMKPIRREQAIRTGLGGDDGNVI